MKGLALRSPLLVHKISIFTPSLSPSPRLYSSTSSNSKPSVLDGSEGLFQFANRTKDRASSQMDRYLVHSVFPPSNWMMQNYFLFTKLQLPTNVEIDAVEFLNGARFACDLAINTMYSNEFVNFANGVVSESAAAEKMKSGLSDTCYEAFLFAMRQSRKAGNSFSLKQLDINGAYLYDVNWDRLSFAEMKQEEALEAVNRSQRLELDQQEEKKGIKEKTDVSHERTPVAFSQTRSAAPEDHTMMIERLQLDVLLETVEHLEVATADNADQVLEKKSSAVWRFESLVTQPDNIDWRIVTVL